MVVGNLLSKRNKAFDHFMKEDGVKKRMKFENLFSRANSLISENAPSLEEGGGGEGAQVARKNGIEAYMDKDQCFCQELCKPIFLIF